MIGSNKKTIIAPEGNYSIGNIQRRYLEENWGTDVVVEIQSSASDKITSHFNATFPFTPPSFPISNRGMNETRSERRKKKNLI